MEVCINSEGAEKCLVCHLPCLDSAASVLNVNKYW